MYTQQYDLVLVDGDDNDIDDNPDGDVDQKDDDNDDGDNAVHPPPI